jgi:hypothetical protein
MPSSDQLATSGIVAGGGVEKVAPAQMNPVFEGVWLKLKIIWHANGPPATPPKPPGVHSPSTEKNRVPGAPPKSVIEVLTKKPKTLLPKVRLLGSAMLNENDPKNCVGMPAKTPLLVFATHSPIVKVVALFMFPKGEPSALVTRKSLNSAIPAK